MRLLWLGLLAICTAAGETATENIILITADGLRWQEVFRGVDPLLANEKSTGMEDADEIRARFARDSREASRRALLPFLWGEFIPAGVILGNRDKGSSVELANSIRVSYPGYSELLTGRTQDEVIRGNEKVRNPSQTLLEFVRAEKDLAYGKTALFASWGVFRWIGASQLENVLISAGIDTSFPDQFRTARIDELLRAQTRVLPEWSGIRFDYFTYELAKEYLRTAKPRVLHIALTETDDWAHGRRYDRVLQMAHFFDEVVGDLWATVESMPEYDGKTTMILTSDHGRGSALTDWNSHGDDVDGAEYIWIAARGPDTPSSGEHAGGPVRRLQDVAPTAIRLLGLDPDDYAGLAGEPVPEITGQ